MKSEMRSGVNGYMGNNLGRRNIHLGSCRQEDQLGPSRRRNSGRVVETMVGKTGDRKKRKSWNKILRLAGGS